MAIFPEKDKKPVELAPKREQFTNPQDYQAAYLSYISRVTGGDRVALRAVGRGFLLDGRAGQWNNDHNDGGD